MQNIIIWGHRGSGFRNTIPSFKKCVDIGVDGIKTEARLSRDGEVILRFLPFIIINGNKILLKEANLEMIKQVKLEDNEEIPTLHEMFEEFNDKIRYNFDIWNVETGIKIIDVAKEYHLLKKVEITKPASYRHSFQDLFKPLREKSRDVTLINSLFSEKQIMQDNYALLEQMKELNVQVVNLSHHRFNLDIFLRVKKTGFKFYVWAVLFKYFMKKYLNLNQEGETIDGIYTNSPDKLVKLRKNMAISY